MDKLSVRNRKRRVVSTLSVVSGIALVATGVFGIWNSKSHASSPDAVATNANPVIPGNSIVVPDSGSGNTEQSTSPNIPSQPTNSAPQKESWATFVANQQKSFNLNRDQQETPSVFWPVLKSYFQANPNQPFLLSTTQQYAYGFDWTTQKYLVVYLMVLQYGQTGNKHIYAYKGKVYQSLNGITAIVKKMPHFDSTTWTSSTANITN